MDVRQVMEVVGQLDDLWAQMENKPAMKIELGSSNQQHQTQEQQQAGDKGTALELIQVNTERAFFTSEQSRNKIYY